MRPARSFAAIEREIRLGHGPDDRLLDDVAALDVATLGREGVRRAREALASEVLGLGPIEPVLADPAATDILVNGDGTVWVDRGEGVIEAGVRLADADAVRRLAVRLAALAGRRLDESQPWVDGLLPGGVRLHAILPPLVGAGAHVSLRVPRARSDGLDGLAATGMFGAGTLTVLLGIVERRCAFVVSGGTGAGKSTLLAAMLAQVPRRERVVLVEDVCELVVDHPHVVRLQGRGANVEGQGAVGLVDLVRQALRMRPDRLVVGEVRGPEVREMLAALNTGHEGGCGTLHANSPADVPVRFEALGALAGMPREAVRAQLGSAVRLVVHVERGARGRRVGSVSVLSADGRTVLLGYDCLGERPGPAWPELRALTGLPDTVVGASC
jgi:pilus assembly protein CpaF